MTAGQQGVQQLRHSTTLQIYLRLFAQHHLDSQGVCVCGVPGERCAARRNCTRALRAAGVDPTYLDTASAGEPAGVR